MRRRWRAHRVVRRIRGHLLFFGLSVGHLSNEELLELVVEGNVRVGAAMRKVGVSAAEAAAVMGRVNAALAAWGRPWGVSS